MSAGIGWVAAMTVAAMVSVTARVIGQAPQQPAQPPPIEGHGGPPQGPVTPQTPRPGGQTGPAGRFPAQQRPKGDPDVIQRGRGIFAGSCGPCHGADARGGQLGGPNLLRSQMALNDKAGELMFPVIKNGRPGTAMPPSPLSDEDIKAVIAFLHDLQSRIGAQGNPPPGEEQELDIVVGNAKAGEAYFAAKCAGCHSATGDMKEFATRIPSPKALQNLWVSGGRAIIFGGGGNTRPAGPPRAFTTVTITLPSGERVSGRLLRLDDFMVTVGQPDGTQRTFRRNGDVPSVEIEDPLAAHHELLKVLTNADMHNVTAYLVTLK